MSHDHAIVCIDHHRARILGFDHEHVLAQTIKAQQQYTRLHGKTERTEHEFFAEVCNALSGVKSVLITGAHVAQADFGNFAEQHRPQLYQQIVGWEHSDRPTENQLVALARQYFLKYDRMAGTPTPT